MEQLALTLGGISKQQLIQRLETQNILLNKYAKILLMNELVEITTPAREVSLIKLTLEELGLTVGKSSLSDVMNQGEKIGLKICSPDVAPFLRLVYFDDKKSQGLISQHQAPDGAINVISKILIEDDEFPKGFYLRKIEDDYWLRGYICDNQYKYNDNQVFIFEGKLDKVMTDVSD